ncbi:MAG: GGDEF domain-containing protein [Acidobacteria bacterium]|nr:GGDEF domain-containing protein [Acidobacteriota bacterium]
MSHPLPNLILLVGDSASAGFSEVRKMLEHPDTQIQEIAPRESDLAGALTSSGALVVLFNPSASSGSALIETVRRQPRGQRTPVLVLSGQGIDPNELEWLDQGADLQAPSPPPVPLLRNLLVAAGRLCERGRELEKFEERLCRAESIDPLTLLANHRTFHDRLHEEFLRCERYEKPLSLLFADLDHFRDINSTYGHKVGDGFLRGVAGFLASAVRKVDLVARYEGEQFALLLPETDSGRAVQVAERLRNLTAGYIYKEAKGQGSYRPLIKTTLSFGVATFPHPSVTNRNDLVERALEALHKAQTAGRNRVAQFQQS